jgi:4'-phosphopantetheinyl transferase EntD
MDRSERIDRGVSEITRGERIDRPDVNGITAILRSLFPPGVEVEAGWSGEIDGPLFPEEEVLIERAVEKRRRTFRAGRVLARRALMRLGFPAAPILATDRWPVWPEGVLGTISHTDECCVVAVTRRGEILGVGVDVEVDGVATEGVFRQIATPGEIEWLHGCAEPGVWATVLFSVKEAFYKSLATIHPHFVSFHDVRLEIDIEASTVRVVPLDDGVRSSLTGVCVDASWRRKGGWVFAAVVLRRQIAVSATR